MTSAHAGDRDIVVRRLRVDLIGPDKPDEVIDERPSDRYLTGILWPAETRMSGEDDDRLGGGSGEDTESSEEEEVPMVGMMRPCVAGVSFAVSGASPKVRIEIEAAYYDLEILDDRKKTWKRRKVEAVLSPVNCGLDVQKPIPVPGFRDGVEVHIRATAWAAGNARLVTATLVNKAVTVEESRDEAEQLTVFQVGFRIRPEKGTRIVPRPDRRAVIDRDDESAALLYRSAHQYAVGHTCSATWAEPSDGGVEWVAAEWMPESEVLAVSADGHPVFQGLSTGKTQPLNASWLSMAADNDLGTALERIAEAYRSWIAQKRIEAASLANDSMKKTASLHLDECDLVAARISDGARKIASNPDLAAAFRLSNCAMELQRQWTEKKPLIWRPFQIAFILLSAISTVQKNDNHRQTMDLLWFPTGGGKTEAYLGLIAFLAFARRITSGDNGTGVCAVMRYTLRLLTTQQFSRAATMILACEAIRRGRLSTKDDFRRLGSQPFGIGLWVGGEATPNSVAKAALILDGATSDGVTPRQIVSCPACNRELKWSVRRSQGKPLAIDVHCTNTTCLLHDGKTPLPIHTVDEDIYTARPTLLLGTVDKFAQIVRQPATGPLFDAGGARTPDLIIQDELHLISGPLGTMVGLYESGIDILMSQKDIPPKVIGSTATIRRASDQVLALFNRNLCQFPPPGLDAEDSGFAVTIPSTEKPGRLYLGISTAGRSAKFTLQAVSGSLLQAGSGGFSTDSQRDPYWTLVAYFNSLRELGGAVVLMQDDVPDSIRLYSRRRNEGSQERKSPYVQELTSRRTQKEVRGMLDEMAIPADRDEAIDVVLASNMLSVGVDIQRLGLMLMNGQPKGIAEYIQATSRVGRRHPGLVVTIFNNSKSRDRSHYETFRTWHSTLYRDVEATSVTPFASRARDRALHASLLVAARHLVAGLSDSPRLDEAQEKAIRVLIDRIVKRATRVDASEKSVQLELERFLQIWKNRSSRKWWNDKNPSTSLLVSAEAAVALRAMGNDARGAISTPNSMRNVEAAVPFRMAPRLSVSGDSHE